MSGAGLRRRKQEEVVMRNFMLLITVAGALALTAVACEEGNTIVNTPGSTTTGISVSGTGQAFGAPDITLITLGVQAQAANVADARETAASTAKAVVDSLKKNGVADKDIQTTQFDIQPQYSTRTPTGSPTITGYQVTNVLSVKVRKIDTTGKVLDDATAAGGNNTLVRGISFTIDDPTALRETARTEAIKDARTKAEQLAKESGVKLGKPISIVEGGGVTPYELAAPALARAADTGTPIESGELTINVTVTVLYAIE